MYFDNGENIVLSVISTSRRELRIQEIISRGFPVTYHYSLFSKSPQKYTTIFEELEIDISKNLGLNSPFSYRICSDKNLTKQILSIGMVSTPLGVVVSKNTLSPAEGLFDGEKSYVVKPISGSLGKGVKTGIKQFKKLKEYFSSISDNNAKFVLEEEIFGEEYRALLVKGKVIAVFRRLGSFVTGDGERRLVDLIDDFNKNRASNPTSRKGILQIDKILEDILKGQGVDLNSVLENGQVIRLSYALNRPAGGNSIDMTDDVSSIFVETCERAVATIPGLGICGADVIVNDLGEPYIIELNSEPFPSSHIYPMQGKSRNVVADMIDILLPGTKRQRHRVYFKVQKMRLGERIKHAIKGDFRPKVTLALPFENLEAVDTRHIVFSGNVQGVGFRAHVCQVARSLNVHGHVRNLKDGTVEAIACGTVDSLDRFLAACEKNHPKATVNAVETQSSRHVVYHGFRVARTEK